MASEQPNPSPPQTAAKTKKRPTSHETPTESTEKQRIKRPSKRKVIRPTEIVSPGEPPKRKQVKLQTIESSDEDDSGSLDSSDEEDVESIDLSDEEEDEYDDTDDDDEDDDDDDDDDAESVYLSDSDEPEEANSKAVVKALTRTVRPASSRNSASATRRPNKNTPQPQSTFVETRTQSSRWIVAQQQASSRDATVTRGASSSRQQTVRQQFHTPNANTSRVRERRPQERGVTRGNSFRLNMSVDVNVSFSGLVTGRNLGFAGVSPDRHLSHCIMAYQT
ncbi:hypothetical protein B0T10DRAFT_544466 [Thelonectria olida]|uniref:Uncharacterized protein n=1 Tax=Thelonectria olida TaxID=1576542 RepID=A0A9P8WGL5_9HYPO|nr:hypothetical protein B0T10DRAFT_544466 [Thelonectria olida]